MIKNIVYSLCCGMVMAGFINSVSASELKTSSLAMAKTQTIKTNKLPEQCQKMFQKADKLIADAEKQPGTHKQLAQMKTKLTSTKQKILKLDVAMQEKSCDKGLVALNNLEKKY